MLCWPTDRCRRGICAPCSDSEVTQTEASPALDIPSVQRRSLGVLSAAQVLSGIAVAGTVAAGALLAAGIAGTEAAAGFAQTSGVVGAAIAALPLARLTLSGGRRGALTLGYGIGATGAVLVVTAAALRFLPLVYVGCLLLGSATAAGFQARYAAADLAPAERRGRDRSIVSPWPSSSPMLRLRDSGDWHVAMRSWGSIT